MAENEPSEKYFYQCASREEAPSFGNALFGKLADTLEKILVLILAVLLVATVAVALR